MLFHEIAGAAIQKNGHVVFTLIVFPSPLPESEGIPALLAEISTGGKLEKENIITAKKVYGEDE